MDLSLLLLVVAALACPIGMGAMMWMMNREGSHQQMGMGSMPRMTRAQHSFDSAQDRLAALQAQKDALEKQIRELEAVQALQERREHLEREIATQKRETRA